MKRSLMGITLAVALLAPAAAHAASAKVTQRVMTLLTAPDTTATATDWKAIGPEAEEALRDIALDGKKLALHRGRALTALVHFKSVASRQALEAVAADAKTPWVARGKAANTLAKSYGADALSSIAPLLSHSHKRMREAAIKAVGLVRAPASKTLLNSRLAQEKNDYLKGLIKTTLTRLNKKARLNKKGGK
jgi:HEAT repeats